ncbi:histidine kinase, partial [Halomonas sp. BBD48]|nr:histidine kinase [Halomonas sp. BBD48]
GYTALSLSAPEAMHFRYRLDGFDRGWHHAGPQRQAIYTGLAPGDYRFRVVALNQDGIASQDEATLNFSVPQVFYLKPPFLLAAGLLLAVLLWRLYRASMRRSAEQLRARLEERHAERERIARELHDTLLQGVQGLMLRFQAVAQTIPEDAPARVKMDQTLDRADQVLSEGRDRVLDLRSAEASSTSLLAALARVGRECALEGAAEFRAFARGSRRPLHPLVREEAYRIGHEAIVNAFKHSSGTCIHLHVAYGLREFEVRVSDDGVGVDAAYLTPLGRPAHWGLRGMHERARNVGAKLTIKRTSPKGTEIRLSIPASSAYRRLPSRFQRWWQRLRNQRS